MKRSMTKSTESVATLFAGIVALLLNGCGSMRQTDLVDWAGSTVTTVPEKQRVPVMVGNVSASVDQPTEVREAVCRYLRDVTTAEATRHGVFILVNTNATTDLLSGFGIDADQDKQEPIAPQAALDVEVTRLEEKLGATVKIGFVSSQKKHAIAQVKVTLRSLSGGENLVSTKKGKSSKGAWGIITSVNREAMKGGQEEWELDGSMIGVACADAVSAGVEDLQKQTLFRAKALDAGIKKWLLRPRTERGP